MEVVIVPSPEDMGRVVADAIEALVSRRPDAVLGLATGSSPVPVYDELVARCQRGELSFARCRAFLLDEYVGLPCGHRESYLLGDRADVHRKGRLRLRQRARPRRLGRRPGHGVRGLRDRHRRGRGGRPAAPRTGQRRPHRLQRAGLVARVEDPPEDADRADPPGQRPVLRLARRGAAPRADPRRGHHLVGAPPRARRFRTGQGGARGGGARGTGDGPRAGLGAAAPPSRHRGPRRRQPRRTWRWPTTTARRGPGSPPGRDSRERPKQVDVLPECG